MIKPQIILDDQGNPTFAVTLWLMYKRLTTVDATTNLSDEELYDRAKFADIESFPINFSDPAC